MTLRSLLERRPIYQRRFARVALIGGSLSTLVAGMLFVNNEITPLLKRPVRPREFAIAWLLVFAATVVSAAFLSANGPQNSTAAPVGGRTKLVLGLLAPYLLIPAAFTAWFFGTGYLGGTELDLVVAWIAFYGLMLVATTTFAPRAIVLLGWVFLLTAVAVPLFEQNLDLGDIPTLLMGLTFGLYHCIYAVFNWRARDTTG